jgi:DNA-binding response OmpR family regulator
VHYKIAIIEDELPIQSMYRLKLERDGFEVATASNGRTGLELLQDFRPDLVLLDLRMPEMSGDELLSRLRSTDWGADIRVVILTNISRNEAPQALRFLHVDHYIVKAHYTPSQVVAVVKSVLGITDAPVNARND